MFEFQMHYVDRVIVLMYHHISPKEHNINISPERFRSHLIALQENGFNVISMDTFIKFVYDDGSVPPNAIVLTFDDGYESFYSYAYPELKLRGWTATNFIVVKQIDSPHSFRHLSYDQINDIPHLNWKQIKEMKANGMSFFNHTYNHHFFVKRKKQGKMRPALISKKYLHIKKRPETRLEYRKRIVTDLKRAESRLQRELGSQPKLLCFPYGAYNKTVIKLGKRLGIELFFTTKPGINDRFNNEVFRLDAGNVKVDGKRLIELIRFISSSS